MEKLRKSILGLILGVLLAFGSLMIFSNKVNAAANIVSVDEIPLNAPVEFNSSIDFSMLNGKKVRIANSTNSLGSTIVSGQDIAIINIDGNALNITGFRSNGIPVTFYSNGTWSASFNRYLTTSATIQWCGYHFDVNDNQWTRDDADAELIAFINTNMTITQPIVYFNVTINANGGEFVSRFHDEDPSLYPNYSTMTFSTSQGEVYTDLLDCLIDTNAGQYQPVKSGYTFIGWNTNSLATTALTVSQINNISSATTLYAIYTSQIYTVSFNSNGADSGTVPASQSVAAGSSFNLPANTGNLTRSGYTFVGWNTSSSATTALTTYTINANTTFYAVWQAEAPPSQYYTVSFNSNGADSGTVPASQSVAAGSSFNLPANTGNLTRTGYTFVGWNTSASATTALTTYTVNSNTTFFAVWRDDNPTPDDKIRIPFILKLALIDESENLYYITILECNMIFSETYYYEGTFDGDIKLRIENWDLNNRTTNVIVKLEGPQYIEVLNKDNSWIISAYTSQFGISNIVLAFPGNALDDHFGTSMTIYNCRYDICGVAARDSELHWINFFKNNEWLNITIGYPSESENPEIQVELGIESLYVNSELTTFRGIVANVVESFQTLFDLRLGWITIGGILSIVISFGVIFFIFKIIKGGGDS